MVDYKKTRRRRRTHTGSGTKRTTIEVVDERAQASADRTADDAKGTMVNTRDPWRTWKGR